MCHNKSFIVAIAMPFSHIKNRRFWWEMPLATIIPVGDLVGIFVPELESLVLAFVFLHSR